MDSNKLPLEPCHLGLSSGASKTISEPMAHSAQTVHLYCTNTNTVSKWSKMRFHMTHSSRTSIGCIQDDFRAYGTFGTNRAPILRQDYHYLQTDSNKLPLEPRHLGVSSDASKTISKPVVHSAQTVHLYCTDTNTVSKQTETRFHMAHSPRSSIGCIQDYF
jgi:aminoglycoside N3'-acetyltransferase